MYNVLLFITSIIHILKQFLANNKLPILVRFHDFTQNVLPSK